MLVNNNITMGWLLGTRYRSASLSPVVVVVDAPRLIMWISLLGRGPGTTDHMALGSARQVCEGPSVDVGIRRCVGVGLVCVYNMVGGGRYII